MLCISICSQPFWVEFALPSKKSINVFVSQNWYIQRLHRIARKKRENLSLPVHPSEAWMLWSGGQAGTEVPCSVAEQGLQVALGTCLRWLELAPEKYSVSGSPALVLERSPMHVRRWKEHCTQTDLWCSVFRVLCCQFQGLKNQVSFPSP